LRQGTLDETRQVGRRLQTVDGANGHEFLIFDRPCRTIHAFST
jgi:hypothetical protein